MEHRIIMPDGKIRWQQWSDRAIFDEGGNLKEYQSVGRDITDRVKAEDELRSAYEMITASEEELRQQYDELARSDEALRTSEGMYRTILNNTGSATIIIEEDTTISFVNPEFERIMGYSKEEVEGKIYWTELVVPDDAEQMNRYHILRRNDPVKAPSNYEFRFITKGRQVRSAYLTIGLIPETKKTVASFVDITEKKQAEEALRESERNYRDILENIQDVYYRSDREGNLIMISPSGLNLMGYGSENEILGRNIAGTVYADPSERRTFLQALEKDGFVNNFEVDLKRPDGTSVTVETSSHKYYDENGNFLGVEGIFRDISGRKRAEGALARSEVTYRTIFENTGTATVLIEENTTISLANAEFERLSGYSREEIEGKKSWTEFVVQEDLDQMLDQHRLRRVRKESALRHYEFRFITKSGTIRKIFLTIDVIPGTKRSVASLMDITGRNRAQ
jgi:PAS domain S-box-containing protein